MRSRVVGTFLLLGASLAAIGLWRAMSVRAASPDSPASWNRRTAARYLDDREVWWQEWPPAQKDHGTVCISCHTNVPYAMVMPKLRQEVGESGLTAPEKIMMDSVEMRVGHWPKMVPFYSYTKDGTDELAASSRATEAVLNAVILASRDAWQGHLRPITRTAFDEAWALQEQTGDLSGGWKWQNFNLAPWESAESGYQGAALLMVAAMNAPDGYANEPEVRRHLDRLRDYLRLHYAAQPIVNQLYVLWASQKELGLLTGAERETLLETIRNHQEADGGWRTSVLDNRERSDHSPKPMESDGYATGLAVLAMEESETASSDRTLQRGLTWLKENQHSDGAWHASSINEKRSPWSNANLFMNDAATAYAVLALERAE
jgi:squalene-hopene/tetraprenyl-beta-curcumene cyclase